jgi:hypothetical protein
LRRRGNEEKQNPGFALVNLAEEFIAFHQQYQNIFQLKTRSVSNQAFHSFLRTLDQMGETFLPEVHCDQTIYLEDPKLYLPP